MLYCAQKATSKVDQCGLGCNVNILEILFETTLHMVAVMTAIYRN